MITKPTLKTKITAIAKFEIANALYDVKPREINIGDKLEARNMRINTATNTFFYIDYYGNRATKDIDFANIKLTY
jgi:prephenate dehydratase